MMHGSGASGSPPPGSAGPHRNGLLALPAGVAVADLHQFSPVSPAPLKITRLVPKVAPFGARKPDGARFTKVPATGSVYVSNRFAGSFVMFEKVMSSGEKVSRQNGRFETPFWRRPFRSSTGRPRNSAFAALKYCSQLSAGLVPPHPISEGF